MSHSVISLGLGLGGGKSATSSGAAGGGGGGVFPNAYSCLFDGTNDTGKITPGSLVQASEYSISLWVNFPVLQTGSHAFLSDASYSHANVTSAGNITFSSATGTGYGLGQGTLSGVIAATDTWYHLCITKTLNGTSNPTWTYYIDGSSVGTNAGATYAKSFMFAAAAGSAVYGNVASLLGSGSGTTTHYETNCKIDELAIFTRLLTAGEVDDIWNGGTPDSLQDIAGLRNWYRMGDGTEGGAGDTVYDMATASAGTTTDMSLFNGPSYSSDVPS